jgi:hypothetical protein
MAVGLENGNILIFAAEAMDSWEVIHDLGLESSHTGTVTRLRFQPLANDPPAETAPLLVRWPVEPVMFFLGDGANAQKREDRMLTRRVLRSAFCAARFLRH